MVKPPSTPMTRNARAPSPSICRVSAKPAARPMRKQPTTLTASGSVGERGASRQGVDSTSNQIPEHRSDEPPGPNEQNGLHG